MSALNDDGVRLLGEFRREVSACGEQMLMNATFIGGELTNVRMSEELRVRTRKLCSDLINTKHDIVHEILELYEKLDEPDTDAATVARYVERIVRWAKEDMVTMHGIVMELEEATHRDILSSGAYILVAESAGNILRPFRAMQRIGSELLLQLGQGPQGLEDEGAEEER
jgi:predicted DNA-binding protein